MKNVNSQVTNNIYVANFPDDTNEEELDQFFSAFGKVERVSLIKDQATGYFH